MESSTIAATCAASCRFGLDLLSSALSVPRAGQGSFNFDGNQLKIGYAAS
jgi:hypothetical protein